VPVAIAMGSVEIISPMVEAGEATRHEFTTGDCAENRFWLASNSPVRSVRCAPCRAAHWYAACAKAIHCKISDLSASCCAAVPRFEREVRTASGLATSREMRQRLSQSRRPGLARGLTSGRQYILSASFSSDPADTRPSTPSAASDCSPCKGLV